MEIDIYFYKINQCLEWKCVKFDQAASILWWKKNYHRKRFFIELYLVLDGQRLTLLRIMVGLRWTWAWPTNCRTSQDHNLQWSEIGRGDGKRFIPQSLGVSHNWWMRHVEGGVCERGGSETGGHRRPHQLNYTRELLDSRSDMWRTAVGYL